MAVGRHSYIRFFPSDWIGGTARMPRLHKSVYFDICCYNWDHNKPCPAAELALMLGDLPNWRELVDDLVAANKLIRGDDGSVTNPRAMSEAEWSFDQWEKKSAGGKTRAKGSNLKTAESTPESSPLSTPDSSPPKNASTPDTEPEPEPEPDDSSLAKANGEPGFYDPRKIMFDTGINLLTSAGLDGRAARRLIGRWEKDFGGPAVIIAISAAMRADAVHPQSYIVQCLNNGRIDHARSADRQAAISREREKIRDPIIRAAFDGLAAKMDTDVGPRRAGPVLPADGPA